MYPAQYKIYTKVTTLILGVVTLFSLSQSEALAVDSYVCNPGENCTVGEFLYTDSYAPETAAVCTLSSKYPDGTAHLSSQALTSTADAWYGYTFTTPATLGYYRAEICCDENGNHMCIDKSFEVKTAVTSGSSSLTTNDISTAVWGYSGRTLTGFNNIVSDVWGYATRTLTSGANITNVTTTSTADVADIKKTADETRLLLEQLVNKPIIENSLEDVQDIDLSQKIEESKKISNELYMNLLLVNAEITKTNKNWNNLTDSEILDSLTDARNLLGDETDSENSNTFFSKVNFLRNIWGFKEADDLYDSVKAVKSSISFVQTGVATYGKSKTLQKELASTVSYLTSTEKLLSLTNKKITEAESLSQLIDKNLGEVNSYLSSWKAENATQVNYEVEKLQKNVLGFNKVPKGQLALTVNYSDISLDKKVKNKLLGLRGLLFANKKLMLNGSKVALTANWLEEGSVVFKTLITNPSLLISQEVPLKYYLPKEIKKENIIESDLGTTIAYDTDKEQLYVEGNYTLKAGETKTIKVRVEDVWEISISEVESLKKQAQSLSEPLAKTAYFAQGVTLKSDIDVSLDKAVELLKEGTTPESKIKSYREAEIEINAAKEKIEKLKELVTQASSSGSILGFVGGSQAIAVWGIVVIVATVFVFLTIYMRKLSGAQVIAENNKSKKVKTSHTDKVVVFLIVSIISGLSSSIAVQKLVLPSKVVANTNRQVLGSTTVDYKALKIVELVSIDGVIKTYQDEGSEAVVELVDSGTHALEVERGEKRVRVVIEGNEVWVSLENVLVK
jgi:hypothetical protein